MSTWERFTDDDLDRLDDVIRTSIAPPERSSETLMWVLTGKKIDDHCWSCDQDKPCVTLTAKSELFRVDPRVCEDCCTLILAAFHGASARAK